MAFTAAKGGRISIHGLAVIFLLTGVVLTAVGVIKVDWQHVKLIDEGQYHEHGLWQDCVKAQGSSSWSCTYIDYSHGPIKSGTENDQHQPRSWKLETMCLLISASVLGILALFFSFYSACCFCCSNVPIVAIIWNVLVLLCTLFGTIGVVIFSIHAHDPKEMAVLGLTSTYQQRVGIAYWLSVGGCGAFVVALLLSIAAAVLIGFVQHRKYDDEPKSKSNRPLLAN